MVLTAPSAMPATLPPTTPSPSASTIPAGSRVILTDGGHHLPLRILEPLEVSPGSRTQVVAALAAQEFKQARVGLTTSSGLVVAPARVIADRGHLVLKLGGEVRTHQRRQDMRADLTLDVVLTLPARTQGGERCTLTGRTVNVSGGGLLISLPECTRTSTDLDTAPARGSMVEVEVALPGEPRLSAVLEISQVDTGSIRGRFVALDRRDRERLVSLVINRRREEWVRLHQRPVDAESETLAGGPPVV